MNSDRKDSMFGGPPQHGVAPDGFGLKARRFMPSDSRMSLQLKIDRTKSRQSNSSSKIINKKEAKNGSALKPSSNLKHLIAKGSQ